MFKVNASTLNDRSTLIMPKKTPQVLNQQGLAVLELLVGLEGLEPPTN